MSWKWVRSLFHRRILVSCMIVAQLSVILYMVENVSRVPRLLQYFLSTISVITVIYIIGKREKPDYKMSWMLLILLFPIFGGLFYLLFTGQASTRRFRAHSMAIESSTRALFLPANSILDQAVAQAPTYAAQLRYLEQYAGFPVYAHTRTEYLTPGEVMFERLMQALQQAQRYIFLEYFIIHAGCMWDEIFAVLKQKAAEGVLVRVLYDDMGCFRLLPENFEEQLQACGIACMVFNPFRPVLSAAQNNRDHRKIASIDGHIALTGGVNIGDEYINRYERFGHWKDAAVLVEGDAAWSMTVMFLQMWALASRAHEDFAQYYPWQQTACDTPSDGLVLPYADSPMDCENVGEHVYLQIINHAREYLYINTPYLIVDGNMTSALMLAAKSGVDVRIVTPHRPDKWLVHAATRSYYRELIQAGIKIYEYSKGFIHSKTFVSDDCVATVGTTNLDFRSLYLHFECGVWMYQTSAVLQVKQDYLKTLEICEQVTAAKCENRWPLRILQEIMRLFAPLL